jgi:hypothetical protein
MVIAHFSKDSDEYILNDEIMVGTFRMYRGPSLLAGPQGQVTVIQLARLTLQPVRKTLVRVQAAARRCRLPCLFPCMGY